MHCGWSGRIRFREEKKKEEEEEEEEEDGIVLD